MPPPLLIELDDIDTERMEFDHAAIYQRMPHRFEFELLDGVYHLDQEHGLAVAFMDCREDAWWGRGHVPGMPILPGVLQLEAAAQLTAFMTRYVRGPQPFIAFGGVDDCRFREAVFPPCRLLLLGKVLEDRSRRVRSSIQGVIDKRVVFETKITGLPLPAKQ